MAAADVLSPPSPPDLEVLEDERVLGASTADQVLERWHGFMAETSKLLQLDEPLRWRLPLQHVVTKATVTTATATDWSSQLGLSFSPVGRVVHSLAASVEQARNCVDMGPKLYHALAVFGEALGPESPEEDSLQTPSELLVEVAELLPTLRQARHLLRRVEAVAENLLRQLSQTYTMAMPGLVRQPLRVVLDVLGELLAVPVFLDGLILENARLRRAFTSYNWIVEKAGAKAGGGSASLPDLPEATALLRELQEAQPLLRGDAFQMCLANVAQALNMRGHAFREQLSSYFRGRMEESELRGAVATSQLWQPAEVLSWVNTYVLCVRSFGKGREEVKLLQELWKMHKKTPVVVLFGRVVWCMGDFLKSYLPDVVAEAKLLKELEELGSLRLSQAKQLDSGFAAEMQGYRARCAAWMASLPQQKLEGAPISESLRKAHAAIFEGLTLALRIRTSLEEYLVLHVHEGVPVPRAALQTVALGFQLLKLLEASPNWRLQELGQLLQQHCALKLQKDLQEVRAKLKPQRASEAPSDALRLCGEALRRILAGEQNASRAFFDVGGIALALCCSGRSESASAGVGGRWRELRIVSQWQEQLRSLCDTSWCYWMRDLLPTLLSDLRVPSLPPLFAALAQPLENLPEGRARQAFLKELRRALEESIVQPLCAKLEEDLRLLVHATMQGTREALPLAPPEEVLALLRLRPLRLTDADVVDLKDQVELRLSRHFYDLAALAPQDAEAYVRMREQAFHRYGLNLVDGGLPAGSLAQGLDVIDVMRNVHLLATQYSYSLHQQFFTQAANQGDAKLRTITVEHLTASIRVHGYGVINTAVNYSVGFLKKKLEVVAEFLADESVKSRLLAERQWMEGRSTYTWARAVETAKFIRRLGATRDGITFLDKLRQVLTQIGNSLGYVRMVRTAGMRSMANALEYLEVTGEELFTAAEEAQLVTSSMEAAQLAEQGRRSVRRCFEASTDHLNLLAEVFVKALSNQTSQARSTQLFHLLVPCLCCAFLDALLNGQAVLAKRATATTGVRGEALLADDGFSVGVAFVLRVFALERSFQSLHWGANTEIHDQDLTTGQARQAAGVPFFEESKTDDRRSKLLTELGRLSANLEAASALFGGTRSSADR
ncbi:unnamed protein product [Durusdinium trenchii]|uniref:Uncharacterized protein n=2 Tax=Durusdinium trenchii TaxID=1381693 RepID=A0ABP0JZL3_9DINO